jgi:branched-chain amino acid transport system substrate-binding protein
MTRLHAQGSAAPDKTLRLGLLTDLSGPYRDDDGPTSVVCAKQAIAEAVAADPSLSVTMLVADHQQKPDIGVGIAREWFDRQNVDVLLGVGNSAVAIACNALVQGKDKIQLNTAAASSDLTGQFCNANLIHWTFDTWCLAHTTATAIMRNKPQQQKWFFIVADYTFGHVLHEEAAKVVKAMGGQVVGATVYPFPATTDFSSFLLQAQAAGATCVGLANGGSDMINCVKQAKEFNLAGSGVTLAALDCFLPDIMSIGPAIAQGLELTEVFYWDLNDRTRAFTKRVRPNLPPDTYLASDHAGTYSGVVHYLKVAQKMGVVEAKRSGRATVAAMKQMPTDDDCFGPGRIRQDGRTIHPAYLFRVKPPAQVHQVDDVYDVIETIPAEEAFRPESEGGCPLVHA